MLLRKLIYVPFLSILSAEGNLHLSPLIVNPEEQSCHEPIVVGDLEVKVGNCLSLIDFSDRKIWRGVPYVYPFGTVHYQEIETGKIIRMNKNDYCVTDIIIPKLGMVKGSYFNYEINQDEWEIFRRNNYGFDTVYQRKSDELMISVLNSSHFISYVKKSRE